MDYKTRNPNLIDWPHIFDLEESSPWPLKIQGCEARELLSPCKMTMFLCCSGFLSHDESLSIAYLAEANRNCPKRLSFEVGDIKRHDFWYEQDWIIRVEFSLCDDSYSRAEYIKPNQFSEMFMRFLNEKDESCLFDQQLVALENSLEYNAENQIIYADLMREYQEFYRLYEAIMGRRAA